MKPSFCGNCLRETTDLQLEDGCWWCARCRNDTPIARGLARGYECSQEPRQSVGGTLAAFARAANRVAPVQLATKHGRWSGREATPGFVIERVRRLPAGGGKPLSRDDARETLRDNSWFAEVRHLGSDRQFHLFERPDVDAAKRAREETGYDVVAALEKAAVRK